MVRLIDIGKRPGGHKAILVEPQKNVTLRIMSVDYINKEIEHRISRYLEHLSPQRP